MTKMGVASRTFAGTVDIGETRRMTHLELIYNLYFHHDNAMIHSLVCYCL
jgi:hypothetical protein